MQNDSKEALRDDTRGPSPFIERNSDVGGDKQSAQALLSIEIEVNSTCLVPSNSRAEKGFEGLDDPMFAPSVGALPVFVSSIDPR